MNHLYYGDNLEILRQYIKDESVDLIYLDPPFNSQDNYNVLFRSPTGENSEAQIEAFEDTWHWNEHTEQAFDEVLRSGNTDAAEMLRAMRSFLGENDMMAYLCMMAVRLIELHRVLKSTGSLYLHCDPTASHYLRVLLDAVFGAKNYRNEIVWLRSRNPKGSQHKNIRFGPCTDIILFYTKSNNAKFNSDLMRRPLTENEILEKYDREDENGRYMDGPILCSPSMGPRPNLVYEYKGFTPGPAGWRVNIDKLKEIDQRGDLAWTRYGQPRRKWRPSEDYGISIGNCWDDISPINSQAKERLGYPTQKPTALLERIIYSASDPGDIVLDPFCGCGTTVHAAHKLGRQWIGIDVTHLAISLVERRLKDAFPDIEYQVHGTPKDLEGAKTLAAQDKYQFEWWAVSLVDAVPAGGKKKGADKGIDGFIYFKTGSRKTERAIVSVKGGENVGVSMIRDLKGVLDREKAPIGVFITLAKPTRKMEQEAAAAGLYEIEGFGSVPRIQILTIEQLLEGAKPRIPLVDPSAGFKRAAREDRSGNQNSLL